MEPQAQIALSLKEQNKILTKQNDILTRIAKALERGNVEIRDIFVKEPDDAGRPEKAPRGFVTDD